MNRVSIRILAGLGAGGLALALAGAASASYLTITIDGDYSDWATVPVLDDDPADNPGSVDLWQTQIANDDNYLYLRNTYHGDLALSTFLALDVDQNPATGYDVFGLGLIGSEASWQNDYPFTQATGVWNDGLGMSGEFFGSGAALLDAYADSNSRELAISLDILFNQDSSPVFPDDSFTLLFYTDAGAGDVSAPIAYTLAVPEPSALALLAVGGLAVWLRRRRG